MSAPLSAICLMWCDEKGVSPNTVVRVNKILKRMGI